MTNDGMENGEHFAISLIPSTQRIQTYKRLFSRQLFWGLPG